MRRFLRIAVSIGGLVAASLVLPFVPVGGEALAKAKHRRVQAQLNLQVQTLSGDFQKWGSSFNFRPMKGRRLFFRWYTIKKGLHDATWWLARRGANGRYTRVVGGWAGTNYVWLPQKGRSRYRLFQIDFPASYKPGTYRVFLQGFSHSAPSQKHPSNPVTLRVLGSPGAVTQFGIPTRVQVTIKSIFVNNDSDAGPRGAGEISICIWLQSGPHNTAHAQWYYVANTGETITLNHTFQMKGRRRDIIVRLNALEDDSGPKIGSQLGRRGTSCRHILRSTKKSMDYAQGHRIIPLPNAYWTHGKGKTQFSFTTTRGGPLRLTVKGTFEVTK